MAEQVKTDRAAIQRQREDIAKGVLGALEDVFGPTPVKSLNGEPFDTFALRIVNKLAPLPPEPRKVVLVSDTGYRCWITYERYRWVYNNDAGIPSRCEYDSLYELFHARVALEPKDDDYAALLALRDDPTPALERLESVGLFTNRYESGYSRNVRGSAEEARLDAANDALETGIELYRKVAT